ncbi:MAG: Rne/Rng family ribonuclease [Gammaproteobacteria bacterium TMED1]|nr:MAG: Rne/Rng family ribonuclease [Gammaproteobacteria bacterium TMED1]|tara:strand:- start:261 stop:1733 length:1473 start_codon:yes stop_codon:yes gene_type:complete
MEEEIFVNVTESVSRVAVTEQGLLREIYTERTNHRSTLGNIYKGKVTRILPAIDGAFVDIGNERDAFIQRKDAVPISSVLFERMDLDPQSVSMRKLLYEGQKLLVQVTKDPSNNKTHRVTANLSLVSRHLVYRPYSRGITISERIEDPKERLRLKEVIFLISKNKGGFIVRTAAENIDSSILSKDIQLLSDRWLKILDRSKLEMSSSIIYTEPSLPLQVIRDIVSVRTSRILVDTQETKDAFSKFLAEFIPAKLPILELSSSEDLVFDNHDLEDQINLAMEERVILRSGGYLVIEQTEAMTTIDVNTGRSGGKKAAKETILATNSEAAVSIPWQLRLRNIGGIVVIDFIDMEDEEHKRQVLRTLENTSQSYRVKSNFSNFSDFGLVQLVRKRDSESLVRTVCEPCKCCRGRGFVKTAEIVCLEIVNEIYRRAGRYKKICLVKASKLVVNRLSEDKSNSIVRLSEALGLEIRLQAELGYQQEEFDVIEVSN